MAESAPAVPAVPAATRSPLWLGGLLFAVALLASIWFVGRMAAFGESLEHRHGLALAQTVAALVDAGDVAALRGDAGDVGTAAYEAVRARLRAAREAHGEFRFVYLMRPMREGDDRFLFLVDAEAPTSPDYSAPGDVYDGPSHNLRQVMDEARPVFSDVVQDEWGEWVSALAPVIDDEGRVVAVLGADMAHEAWLDAQGRYRAFALLISGLVLSLVALFLLGLHLQRRAANRLLSLGRELADRVDELEQAQEGLRLADVVVRHTSEAIMVLDPRLRVLRVNPAYLRLSARREADVLGKVPFALENDPGLKARVEAAIAAGDHWEEEIIATRPDGARYPLGALGEVVRGADGRIEHFVLVLQDLSSQKALEQRLRELSATDGLTRIANRRSFDEGLAREWARALRQQTPLSVVMADIDFFKRYNDQYGHVAGDGCLQQVAAALKAGVREGGDFVARYGGEEFAVVLPGADATAARAVAESLRASVEARAIPAAAW
jgi:diguanylate cyclase (GGDEF)-like protein/PAS domain S-box-containing protein